MGVVFNGVTIAAGTNKFYFNGTSVKDVYFNGVHVWSGLPTFSSGTSYKAVDGVLKDSSASDSWVTVKTSTFKGGDGSTCSVRAAAAHGSFWYEYTQYVKSYGRVLRNGSQIAYRKSSSTSTTYSSFVTSSANNGDVFSFQTNCSRANGKGGGQIYTSTDSSGYW